MINFVSSHINNQKIAEGLWYTYEFQIYTVQTVHRIYQFKRQCWHQNDVPWHSPGANFTRMLNIPISKVGMEIIHLKLHLNSPVLGGCKATAVELDNWLVIIMQHDNSETYQSTVCLLMIPSDAITWAESHMPILMPHIFLLPSLCIYVLLMGLTKLMDVTSESLEGAAAGHNICNGHRIPSIRKLLIIFLNFVGMVNNDRSIGFNFNQMNIFLPFRLSFKWQ